MIKNQCSRKEYSKIITDSLIEALEEMLGKVGMEIVLYHLQIKHQMKLENIVEKPQLLEETLKELLGSCGELILRKTMQLSSSRMKYNFSEEETLSFTNYVKKVIVYHENTAST